MSNPPGDSTDEAEKAAVEAVIRANYDAFLNRVTDEDGTFAADNVTIWDVFEPELIVGLEARKEFQRRDIGQSVARGTFTHKVTIQHMTLHGNVAISRQHVDFSYAPPNAVSGRVRVTQVLEKIDGTWKLIHTHEDMEPTGVPSFDE